MVNHYIKKDDAPRASLDKRHNPDQRRFEFDSIYKDEYQKTWPIRVAIYYDTPIEVTSSQNSTQFHVHCDVNILYDHQDPRCMSHRKDYDNLGVMQLPCGDYLRIRTFKIMQWSMRHCSHWQMQFANKLRHTGSINLAGHCIKKKGCCEFFGW